MTLVALDTDTALVSAARGGDDRAFEGLYSRYRQQIRAFAYRMTHDHDRAEDITQEVFIAALRRLRETEGAIAFRPWIYEIARNACIDEHRRVSRVREIPIEPDSESGWVGPALASVPSAEAAVESKQSFDDLRGAFRGLSERYHRVIVLRELEGRSYREIGDQLGMGQSVVESTLFRARRRLTEEYEDLASGRRCADVRALLADQAHSSPQSLGLRDRRALACHLEHCRPCRREAWAAGWIVRPEPRRVGKVAVLLPIPLLRLPSRLFARAAAIGRAAPGIPSATVAIQAGDSTGPIVAGGRAAAAAAALLVAVGGGLTGTMGSSSHRSAGRAGSAAGVSMHASRSSWAAAGSAAAGADALRAAGPAFALTARSVVGEFTFAGVHGARGFRRGGSDRTSSVAPGSGAVSGATTSSVPPTATTRPGAGSGTAPGDPPLGGPGLGDPGLGDPALGGSGGVAGAAGSAAAGTTAVVAGAAGVTVVAAAGTAGAATAIGAAGAAGAFGAAGAAGAAGTAAAAGTAGAAVGAVSGVTATAASSATGSAGGAVGAIAPAASLPAAISVALTSNGSSATPTVGRPGGRVVPLRAR